MVGVFWLIQFYYLIELRRNPIGQKCQFKLDGHWIVGTVIQAGQYYVLIEDPECNIHKVKRNEIFVFNKFEQ